MKRIFTDVLVIGAGPGGMAAALKAKDNGCKVLLVDRMAEMGGILPQCIHNGFGLQNFKQDLTGPEFADIYIKRIAISSIEVMLHTMALEITKYGHVILSNNIDGLIEVIPKAIILAMGCRERTRQQVNIPGTRPAGIFTAGVAQRFMNIEGYIPGKNIVIVGSGDIGLIMARRMTLEGSKVSAVTELLPYPGGLTRNIVQCLDDFHIPLYLRHNVINIHGKDRVEGVTISPVDDNGNPTGKRFEITCDTLLFSVGLIPENELSRMIDLELSPVTGGPLIDDHYQTSHQGVFICGNAAFVNDLADYVSIEGEIAGESAAKFVLSNLPKTEKVRTSAGENVRMVTPNFISRDDSVTLYIRVTTTIKDVIINSTNDIVRMKKNIVKPGEMVEIHLDKEKLAKIKGLKEFKINVRKDH
jgi:NADPH-dependent 2,4-dienoyl-CoA reductase/sulfur reductase-like enzyme